MNHLLNKYRWPLVVILFVFHAAVVQAQDPPCLTGWVYRTPVYIDNTGNSAALTDYQVLVELNTQQLIANNKVRIDGADLRFLDKNGSVLSYWIENNTYNTDATQIWVKIPELTASTLDSIYLFYGQPTASAIADGDATFDLFDDFLGGSVDNTKWDACYEPSISVAGGTATFSSSALAAERATLLSVGAIDAPVIVEQYVEAASEGQGFLGFQNTSGDGYAMTFEFDLQETVRLQRLNTDADCMDLNDVHPSQSAARSANAIEGIWSFAWYATDEQRFEWPGMIASQVRNDTEYPFPGSVHVAVGNIDKAGSLEVDWLRVRKYTAVEPATSLGTEVAEITEVTASSNAPVCENSTLTLEASFVTGANYSWEGPDSFSSVEQNPVIAAVQVSQSGYFVVTAEIDGGCSSVKDSVLVQIDPSTDVGSIAGNTVLCAGENEGVVEVDDQVGEVVRWETSPTGLAPWSTIANTTTTLSYADLVSTTYYRAVIKSGVCDEIAGDSVQVQIDENTVAGVVLGASEGCAGEHSGTVEVNGHVGDVLNWQYLEEESDTWVDVTGTDIRYNYDGITVTTYYRALIQNGVCESLYADSVEITIHPIPQPSFDATTVCLGVATTFENQSTVTDGSIRNYLWNFDDGSSGAIENPEHIYAIHGDYDVVLRVETEAGCFDEFEKEIQVNPLPQVDFFHTNVCKEFEMEFKQNVFIPIGGINEFSWDFGDQLGTSILPNPDYLYAEDGDYEVKLVATSSENCKDSVYNTVTVYPRADLDFEVEDVFLGQTSEFVNNSTISAGNLTFVWFFQDGQSSELVNPVHDYQSAGAYDVMLVSTSSNGLCQDTIVKTHVVNDQTKAEFSVENVCLYDSARFVNESFIFTGTLTYGWDFGDGDSSTAEHPVHKYENPGTYLVSLTATSDLGSVSTFNQLITIYPLPSAGYIVNDVCDEETVSFSNLSSISGGEITYNWSFGDNNTSSEFQPNHVYATDGTYTVQLVATSNYECTDTTIDEVVIFPLPQTIFYVDAVCDGFPSVFADSTTIDSGTVIEYAWDFGDGTNSIEQHPVKQFLNPGTYLVQLTATSDKNCIKSYSENVKVITAPIADFTIGNVCFRETVNPVNLSTSDEGQLTFEWFFGDGDSSILTDPVHSYDFPGLYTVQLIITSSFGCQDAISNQVVIFSLPTVEAGEDQITDQGYSVTLQASGAENYIWTPDDGLDNAGSATPVATPFETTTYTVSATDENGCTGSATTTVEVEKTFKLEPSNILTPDGNNINDTWYIENITSFEDSQIQVFDRWGKKVFDQVNYQNDWGGVSDTDILPDGDYYYVITSPSNDKIYKGTITILRNHQ